MINKYIHKVTERDLYAAYKLFFNTFSSEPRLRIINLLKKKPMNVGEIAKRTKLEQSCVSHNLKRLKCCGFVKSSLRGKYRYYMLNEETIKPIIRRIDRHMEKNCLLIIKRLKRCSKK